MTVEYELKRNEIKDHRIIGGADSVIFVSNAVSICENAIEEAYAKGYKKGVETKNE